MKNTCNCKQYDVFLQTEEGKKILPSIIMAVKYYVESKKTGKMLVGFHEGRLSTMYRGETVNVR